MFAIIEACGRQYKVKVGDVVHLERLDGNQGDTVSFNAILVSEGESTLVGDAVKGKTVSAEIIAHGKGEKIIVFKYKAKKNIRKKRGHRQQFTAVKINAIS